MKSFQATAIRICGAATLVVVALSLVEIGQRVLGLDVLPGFALSLGLAVLVSLTAFLVANAPRIEIAGSICLGSLAVIATLAALFVDRMDVGRLAFLDIVLLPVVVALLGRLCHAVLKRRAASTA